MYHPSKPSRRPFHLTITNLLVSLFQRLLRSTLPLKTWKMTCPQTILYSHYFLASHRPEAWFPQRLKPTADSFTPTEDAAAHLRVPLANPAASLYFVAKPCASSCTTSTAPVAIFYCTVPFLPLKMQLLISVSRLQTLAASNQVLTLLSPYLPRISRVFDIAIPALVAESRVFDLTVPSLIAEYSNHSLYCILSSCRYCILGLTLAPSFWLQLWVFDPTLTLFMATLIAVATLPWTVPLEMTYISTYITDRFS